MVSAIPSSLSRENTPCGTPVPHDFLIVFTKVIGYIDNASWDIFVTAKVGKEKE
jgi:hypothetical protein